MKALDSQPEKRSRAAICLLLACMFAFGASRLPSTPTSGADSAAHAAGAWAPFLVCLALGTYFAFRDRRPVARVISSLWIALILAAVGLGAYEGFQKAAGGIEVDRELSQLRAGLLQDPASDALELEEGSSTSQSLAEASNRLQASTNPHAAEFGRMLAVIGELNRATEQELAAALEATVDIHYLDPAWMADERDFDWRRSAAERVRSAAKEALESQQTFPERARRALLDAGCEESNINAFLRGVRDVSPAVQECLRAQIRLSEAHLALIGFVEQHVESVVLYDDGGFRFSDDELMSAYDLLDGDVLAAEDEVLRASAVVRQVAAGAN